MLSKKFCPECESENVQMTAGGITGEWMCGDCGYSGIFPEKTLIAEGKVVSINKKVSRKIDK